MLKITQLLRNPVFSPTPRPWDVRTIALEHSINTSYSLSYSPSYQHLLLTLEGSLNAL